eukprot:gnl/MRDRNA2_/MRDRNA2_86295_c0_seq1.p1 gnl/MRDRNA2_/MRDRNA2_86295_c0~~gnl/MRDRNA2_/MRDRNA2_86295_c0_seq1.p1  ORF type:complete len:381 (-),score=40.62 gnl/MRDRNA2_/MRDRNA2_86295_c0_seq1:142-1284(-)
MSIAIKAILCTAFFLNRSSSLRISNPDPEMNTENMDMVKTIRNMGNNVVPRGVSLENPDGNSNTQNVELEAAPNEEPKKRSMAKLVKKLFTHLTEKGSLEPATDGVFSSQYAKCYGNPQADFTMLTSVAGSKVTSEYDALLVRNRLKLAKLFDYEYCQFRVDMKGDDMLLTNISQVHTETFDRSISWTKELAISEMLERGRKRIVWIDADAVIVHLKKFEDFLELHGDRELLFPGNDTRRTINAGVLMTKNSDWSRTFWKDILDMYPRYLNPIWGESDNAALNKYMQENSLEFEAHGMIIPVTTLNKWSIISDGLDFIMHKCGVRDTEEGTKYDELLRYMKYLETIPDDKRADPSFPISEHRTEAMIKRDNHIKEKMGID